MWSSCWFQLVIFLLVWDFSWRLFSFFGGGLFLDARNFAPFNPFGSAKPIRKSPVHAFAKITNKQKYRVAYIIAAQTIYKYIIYYIYYIKRGLGDALLAQTKTIFSFQASFEEQSLIPSISGGLSFHIHAATHVVSFFFISLKNMLLLFSFTSHR